MLDKYILGGPDGRTPIPATTDEWASSFETERHRVAESTLPNGCWVSTVFLGIDHRFGGSGPPILFETMVFGKDGSPTDLDMERCSTYDEAEKMHRRMVEKWTNASDQQVSSS